MSRNCKHHIRYNCVHSIRLLANPKGHDRNCLQYKVRQRVKPRRMELYTHTHTHTHTRTHFDAVSKQQLSADMLEAAKESCASTGRANSVKPPSSSAINSSVARYSTRTCAIVMGLEHLSSPPHSDSTHPSWRRTSIPPTASITASLTFLFVVLIVLNFSS
jgi:hypothetical protein